MQSELHILKICADLIVQKMKSVCRISIAQETQIKMELVTLMQNVQKEKELLQEHVLMVLAYVALVSLTPIY